MWIKEYRREHHRLSELLLWDTLVSPSVLQLKDGALMSCLRLRGPDLDSAEDTSLVAQAARLNNLFRRFGSGWGLMSEMRRQEVCAYPTATWPDAVSARVDAERRTLFTQPGQHYETVATLTLIYATASRQSSFWRRVLFENLPTDDSGPGDTYEYFLEECHRTQAMLRGSDFGEACFLEGTELLAYLHSTVNIESQPVGVPDPPCYLDSYLTSTDLHAGLAPRLGSHYLRCLGIKRYPEQTYPGILDPLNQLPFPYRLVTRYLPMDRDKAVKEISKYVAAYYGRRKSTRAQVQERVQQKESGIVERAALELSDATSQAQADVEHGRVSFGYLTTTVVLWAETMAELDTQTKAVQQALHGEGFVTKVEDLNAVEAWLGSIPGNTYANVRRPLLHSQNLAHLFPATAPWRGPERNEHLGGPCVFQAVGKGQTPVRVSLHAGDVGHFGLIGSTGDGKSTFLNFECLQSLRYGAHLAIFDKGGAARILTYLVGGSWYDLGTMPLQPLAGITTELEIGWAVDWLSGILTQENVRVTPPVKAAMHAALAEMASWDVRKRTMTNLATLIEHRQAKQALYLYTHAGPYGLILDGDKEDISSNPWLCFEMGSILETPSLLGSVLPALFHHLEQRLTGPPTQIVLHEGWVALDHPFWSTRLRAWLKGLRVRNGSVGLLTQSLADAVNSNIMPALLDNVASWILTPSEKAEEEEIGKYYRAIGLNTRQRELLHMGQKKRDYYVMNANGHTMIDLALGPVALAACRTWGPSELARYVAMHEEDRSTFVRRYFQEQGIDFEAVNDGAM